MTVEELKQKELESFMEDFMELIDRHSETLLTLKMGICIDKYNISCMHYKGDSYSIHKNGEIGIKPVEEWYD